MSENIPLLMCSFYHVMNRSKLSSSLPGSENCFWVYSCHLGQELPQARDTQGEPQEVSSWYLNYGIYEG